MMVGMYFRAQIVYLPGWWVCLGELSILEEMKNKM